MPVLLGFSVSDSVPAFESFKIMGLLMLCDFVKWMYHVNRLIKKYNILALVSHICKIHPNKKLVALVMHA
jgi:hypothetical protein